MEIGRALAWSIVNNEPHPRLTQSERKIDGVMPVIEGLFPGINYYSIGGFHQVRTEYAEPVLTKLFPDLRGLSQGEVRQGEKVEISPFLPSKGYEHADNPEWKKELDRLIAA